MGELEIEIIDLLMYIRQLLFRLLIESDLLHHLLLIVIVQLLTHYGVHVPRESRIVEPGVVHPEDPPRIELERLVELLLLPIYEERL